MRLNVIGKIRLWFTLSSILILIGIFAMVFNFMVRGKPMNFGIDFTGGTLLTLRFEKAVSMAEVRGVLGKYKLAESVIQKIGEQDITIRSEPLEGEQRAQILDDLGKALGRVELLEADTIGPLIGKELRTQAFWALAAATVGMLIYVALRFEFRYAVAAILALYHDAIITVGLMALLWRNVETPFIAAILTILGYSINDTVVIFDRIRENLKKPGGARQNFGELVNDSINQAMARSINTVLTTLIMCLAILIFGGATLKDFALTLLIGFVCGCYSSIFVASPIIVLWEKRSRPRA